MKKLFILSITVIISCAAVFAANNTGTLVYDTVRPPTTDSSIPTHEAVYGKGGFRSVTTFSDMSSISVSRRELKMQVAVTSANKLYELNGCLDNSCWSEIVGGASASRFDQLGGDPRSNLALGSVLNNYSSQLQLRNKNQYSGKILKIFGDSYSREFSFRYPAHLAPMTSQNIILHAVSGAQCADAASDVYAEIPGDNSTYIWYMAGNDVARYNAYPSMQSFYRACAEAQIAWLATPDIQKVKKSLWSTNGSWSTSAYYSGLGKTSFTYGDTLSGTVYGNAVMIAYTAIDNSGGTFSVSVDGILMGNYTTAAPSAINTFHYATIAPQLIVYRGLSEGKHTILVTLTSSTNAANTVDIEWMAGSGGNYAVTSPLVVTGTHNQLKQSYYLSNSLDSSVALLYAAGDRQMITELQNLGMNVYLNDVVSYMDNAESGGDLGDDGAHPTDAGAQKQAQGFARSLDRLLKPVVTVGGDANPGNILYGCPGGYCFSDLLSTSSNFLGIGTNSPKNALHIKGTSQDNAGIYLETENNLSGRNPAIASFRNRVGGGYPLSGDRLFHITAGAFNSDYPHDSIHSIYGGMLAVYADGDWSSTSQPTYFTFKTADTAGMAQDRLRINKSGNVLIGTTTDNGHRLEVSGTIHASSTITGSNLSGTNTGDQDLSPYALTSSLAGASVNYAVTAGSASSVPWSGVTAAPTVPTSSNWPGAGSCSSQVVTGIGNGSSPTCSSVSINWITDIGAASVATAANVPQSGISGLTALIGRAFVNVTNMESYTLSTNPGAYILYNGINNSPVQVYLYASFASTNQIVSISNDVNSLSDIAINIGDSPLATIDGNYGTMTLHPGGYFLLYKSDASTFRTLASATTVLGTAAYTSSSSYDASGSAATRAAPGTCSSGFATATTTSGVTCSTSGSGLTDISVGQVSGALDSTALRGYGP